MDPENEAPARSHASPPAPQFLPYAENAHSRARIFAILATTYNAEPDASLIQAIQSLPQDFFLSLQQADDLNPDLRQGLLEISAYAEESRSRPASELIEALQTDWRRLFRGLDPECGPMPPYETLYLGGEGIDRAAQPLADLYRAYGAAYREAGASGQDYLGVELDFLRYLSEREADAWQQGDREQALSENRAISAVFSAHTGRWACDFCEQAIPYARTGLYRGLLYLTISVITDAKQHRVRDWFEAST